MIGFYPWEESDFVNNQKKESDIDAYLDFSEYKGYLVSNVFLINPRYFWFLYSKRSTFYNKDIIKALEHYATRETV
jgi:hypothetical protein